MHNIKENIQTDFLDEHQGSQNNKQKKIFKTLAERLLLQFNSKILSKMYQQRCQSKEQLIYYRFLFFLNTIIYLFIILRFFIMTNKYDCSDSQIQNQNEQCSQNLDSSQIQIIAVLTILIVLNILTIIYALKLNPIQLNVYIFIQQFYHCCYLVFKVDNYTNNCLTTAQSGICLNLTLLVLVLLNIFAQSYWIFRCFLFASLFCSLMINQYQKFQVVDISLSSILLLISLISIYYHESYKKIDFYKNFSIQKKGQRWQKIFQQRLSFPTIVLTADQDLQNDFKVNFVNDQFKACFNIPQDNMYPINLNRGSDKSSSYINLQQSIQNILKSVSVPINTEQISKLFTNQVKAQQGGGTYIQKFKASLIEKIFHKMEVAKAVSKSNEAINQKSITSQTYTLKKDSSRKNKKEIQTNQQAPSINEKNPQSMVSSQNMLPLSSKANQFENKYLQISLMEVIVLFMNDCQKRITLFQQISDQQDDLMYSDCIYSPMQKDTQNRQNIQKGYINEQEEKHLNVHIVDCYEDNQVNIMIVLNDISMKYENKRLYEMNNYKDKLLATVSHDLKTPLSAMISLVESCIICIKDEEIKKILQDTLKVSDLLSHLINDIQDYGQIQNCSLKLLLNKFNIKDCLKEILDIFEVKKRKGIDLVLDFEPKVNVGNTDIYQIHSDSQRLKQILLNLIGNAIKFTMKGSIKIFFEISFDQDTIEITVTDTGIGIPFEIQQKLFKEYNTFDTPSGLNKNGVGLGLYVSKKLAGLLGPSENIKLVSKEGEGSSFSFVIFKNLQEKLKERAKLEQAQQVSNFKNQNISESKEQMNLFGEEDISDDQNQQQSFMISEFKQYNFQQLFQKSKFSLTNLSKSPIFIQFSQTDNCQNSQKHFKNQRYFQTSTNNTFVKSNLNTSSEVVKGLKNYPNFNLSEKNNQQDCEQLINLSPQNTKVKNLNQSSSFDNSRLNLNSNLKNMVYSQMNFNNSNNAMNLSSLQFSPQYHSQYKLKTKNILFSKIDRDIEDSFFESQNILIVKKIPEQSGLQYLNKENNNFSDNFKDKFVGGLEAIQSQHSQSPTINLDKSAFQKESCINQSYQNNKEEDEEEDLGKQKYQAHRITFECLNPVNNKNHFREYQQSSSSLNTQMLKELKQTNLEVSDMSYIHTNEFSNSVLNQIFAKETHILVVDDEEINHKVFQHQFKQFSTVKIHSAYNGQEAINKILQNEKLIGQYNQQRIIEGSSNSFYQSQNIDIFDQIESIQNKKSQFYQSNFEEEKKNKENFYINLSSLKSSINNSLSSTEKENKYIPDEKMGENLNINQIASRKYEFNFNNMAQINQVGLDKSYNIFQQTESPINISSQVPHTLEQEIQKSKPNKNNQPKIIKNDCKKLLVNQELQVQQPQQFSQIFMDFSMPLMDGLQTIQKIRQLQAEKLITQKIFIFMVSGYDQKSDTNEFLSNGADGIISKPVSKLKIAQAFYQTNCSL